MTVEQIVPPPPALVAEARGCLHAIRLRGTVWMRTIATYLLGLNAALGWAHLRWTFATWRELTGGRW